MNVVEILLQFSCVFLLLSAASYTILVVPSFIMVVLPAISVSSVAIEGLLSVIDILVLLSLPVCFLPPFFRERKFSI